MIIECNVTDSIQFKHTQYKQILNGSTNKFYVSDTEWLLIHFTFSLKLKKIFTLCKICAHFLPKHDIAIEDNTLFVHSNTLQSSLTCKPGNIVTALQNMVHR